MMQLTNMQRGISIIEVIAGLVIIGVIGWWQYSGNMHLASGDGAFVETAKRQVESQLSDPRKIFKAGAHMESDELTKLVDTHFPKAKFFPDQTIQVTFDSKSYLIQTRKLNDTPPAIYEIVSVSPPK